MVIFAIFMLAFVVLVVIMINEARKTVAEINKLNESLIFFATLNERKVQEYRSSNSNPVPNQ